MFIPFWARANRDSKDEVAGPMVQIILVFRMICRQTNKLAGEGILMVIEFTSDNDFASLHKERMVKRRNYIFNRVNFKM